jgi:hypothetical protein
MRRSIALIATVLGLIWIFHKSSSAKPGNVANTTVRHPAVALSAKTLDPVKAVAGVAAKSANPAESLKKMTGVLSRFAKPTAQVKDLIALLNEFHQEPVTTHDANPYSGEMAIVRTRQPLPGTRYFHAQFFNDQAGIPFVQHMSFEFKPGPTSFVEAVAAVREEFNLPEPQESRADYAKWNLPDGHIVWVKTMDHSDLAEDPFNAYTVADIGTVRVAVEAEIH